MDTLLRLGGQVALFAVLLAVGCNLITGVGDLKVVAGCERDAGGCAPGTDTSEAVKPVKPLPPDLGEADGGADEDPCGMGAISEFTPSNVIGLNGSSPCGSGGAGPGSGGAGSGGAEVGAAGGLGAAGAAGLVEGEVDAGAAGTGNGMPPTTFCAPGVVQACTSRAGCTGKQTCAADGSGFSECQCPAVAVTPISGSVAAACASDADCAAGLDCVTSADRTGPFSAGDPPGGPQNGYCSRSCLDDADCKASDPLALCLGPGGGLDHCFQSCDGRAQTFPTQCNGRDDLTCLELDADHSYCHPTCQDDAACAPGFCNLATGLCQDAKPTGKPIGAACTVDEDCAAGLCVELRSGAKACSGLCTFGSVAGCGFSADATERDAACLYTGFDNGAGAGFCAELCDTDEDCEQQSAGWTCAPWSIDELLARAIPFQRTGFCELVLCSEDCLFAGDGECDDGGPGSLTNFCALGTDCTDCGAR